MPNLPLHLLLLLCCLSALAQEAEKPPPDALQKLADKLNQAMNQQQVPPQPPQQHFGGYPSYYARPVARPLEEQIKERRENWPKDLREKVEAAERARSARLPQPKEKPAAEKDKNGEQPQPGFPPGQFPGQDYPQSYGYGAALAPTGVETWVARLMHCLEWEAETGWKARIRKEAAQYRYEPGVAREKDPKPSEIATYVTQLGANEPFARERAQSYLLALGNVSRQALEEALRSRDAEVRLRAGYLLKSMGDPDGLKQCLEMASNAFGMNFFKSNYDDLPMTLGCTLAR